MGVVRLYCRPDGACASREIACPGERVFAKSRIACFDSRVRIAVDDGTVHTDLVL